MTAAPATLDRIRHHLVGLRMPRALEVLEHLLRQLERGRPRLIQSSPQLCCGRAFTRPRLDGPWTSATHRPLRGYACTWTSSFCQTDSPSSA